MGRSSKPVQLLNGHKTNAEKELRKTVEKSLISGEKIREAEQVKKSPAAHKAFRRLKKMMDAIEKNDALFEAVINRYCLLLAECADFEAEDNRLHRHLDELEKQNIDGKQEFADYIKLSVSLDAQIVSNGKLLQTKRKMLLDIEKEMVMTINAQMRAIPKQPAEAEPSGMGAFLQRRGLGA